MANVTTSGKTEANTMPTGFLYHCNKGHLHKTYAAYIRCQNKK